MKKLIIVMLTLFLAVSVNEQDKVKKRTMKEAQVALNLSKDEVKKVKAIMAAKRAEVKEIRAKDIDKKEQWKAIKAVTAKTNSKVEAVLGKEKALAWKKYWAKPKKMKMQ